MVLLNCPLDNNCIGSDSDLLCFCKGVVHIRSVYCTGLPIADAGVYAIDQFADNSFVALDTY